VFILRISKAQYRIQDERHPCVTGIYDLTARYQVMELLSANFRRWISDQVGDDKVPKRKLALPLTKKDRSLA
jgi:hypothetical protein